MGAGASWKAKREAMGKSLEQVSAETRISRKYLQGMEEGRFDGWPERVFSAGFVRAYAKYLAEDPEPVLDEYRAFRSSRDDEEPALHAKPEWLERERQKGTRRVSYTAAAAVVLLIGLVLAWYSFRTASRVPPPPPEVAPAPAPPPQAAPAENAVGAPTELAPAAVGPEAPRGDNAASAPPAPVPATVSSIGGTGPVTSPYQLFLEASELTWMMYSLDDAEPVDVMMYPGDKISIQANKTIRLKLGNAGGVAATLNGRRLDPFGQRGQVKEFRVGE